MAGEQGPGTPGTPPTRFSPDGYWWWDGIEWKPAVSADGLWRWNGQAWVAAAGGGAGAPAMAGTVPPGAVAPGAQPSGRGAGMACIIGVGIFVAVVVVVAIIVVVILATMGGQIANVFSNVAAALGSTPTP